MSYNADPHFTLKLSTWMRRKKVPTEDIVTIHIDPALQAGWPRLIGSHRMYAEAVTDSPTIADVDEDGDAEILIVFNGELLVYNHDGTYLEGWPKKVNNPYAGMPNPAPAVADLDRDGFMEIIVGNESAWLHVFHHNGSYFEGWPRKIVDVSGTSHLYEGVPTVADINNDGDLDIVVGVYLTLVVVDLYGTPLPGWPATLSSVAYVWRGSQCRRHGL